MGEQGPVDVVRHDDVAETTEGRAGCVVSLDTLAVEMGHAGRRRVVLALVCRTACLGQCARPCGLGHYSSDLYRALQMVQRSHTIVIP